MDKKGLLIAAGQALYGKRWQTPVARDLGTTYRTVRNWISGRHAPPADLEDRLVALLRDRALDIGSVLESIDTEDGESTSK